uniref:Secreted protein n=1 Tax=Triticum urartu TaxID=4572 RepID=A0A8R7UQZ1_TRIUA
MCPVKLLLLALSALRFFIASHVVDGNCPANKLLEMFSTWRGWAGVGDASSWSFPVSWLKLTSSVVMLLDDTNSSGRPPDSEL